MLAPKATPHPGMTFVEFVVLIASIMALNALAIDSMLPALPAMGEALGVERANDRQWIITAYLLGFGAAQLPYGPLADRFGRRPVLLGGIALYTVFSIAAAFASSLEMMLVCRVLQGVGSASTRVLAVSIVRDCYSGRTMARVMSLTFIVFLAAPIVAPTLGQAIVLVAPWPWIFAVLAALGLILLVWAGLRLPETLPIDQRLPISLPSLAAAYRTTLTERTALGYTLAMTLVVGCLFGFVTSAQQVFEEALGAGRWFTLAFALVAASMGVSAYLNSRIVERLGTRRVSHTALLGFIGFAGVHAALAVAGWESLPVFIAMQSGMMFCFGLIGSNFGSSAMEPLGRIAGVGSSVQGFITTLGGAMIGGAIGQSFDGTAAPLTLAFTGCGLGALVIVLVTERGRLFEARTPAAEGPRSVR